MHIAYYISDYGYGHASRSVAIIRRLLKDYHYIKVTVCHSFAFDFLKQSLQDPRVSFRNVKTDIGYIIDADTLEIDRVQLKTELAAQQMNWPMMTHLENLFLQDQMVELVLSDISALGIEAAKQTGINSIGISNFLWTDVYQSLVTESTYTHLSEAYEKMSYYISLEGNIKTISHQNEPDIPFFSRDIDWNEVERIRTELVKDDKILVFYGLGMKINHDLLVDQLKLFQSEDCTFIVSSHVNYESENVYRIPNDYLETQHFVAASDLVITKPGWSTVSEAIQGESSLLLLQRESFLEDATTIRLLKKQNVCQTLSFSQLKGLNLNNESIFFIQKEIQLREKSNGLDCLMNRLDKFLVSD